MYAPMHIQVPDRRRHDLLARLARATFPVRSSVNELLDGLGDLPCRILGHRWKEVPSSHVSARAREAHRMRFRCSRCHLTAGFTN
jgi:hypothetical protein